MDDRRLTLIIVPHGDSDSRTYHIRYRRLKVFLGVVAALLMGGVVMVSMWFYLLAQAARVPGLEQEVRRLEEERAQVAELARTLAEVEEQYERVRVLLGADAAPGGRDTLLPPLRRGTGMGEVASRSAGAPDTWPLAQPGWITRELTVGGSAHPGIDVAVPQDTYIRAAADGVVRDVGTDDIYGHYVLIAHADGYETMYGHASRLFVAAGDSVERREVIALSGSTGRSTAPHLHFEVRKDGEPVDPLALMRQENHDDVP